MLSSPTNTLRVAGNGQLQLTMTGSSYEVANQHDDSPPPSPRLRSKQMMSELIGSSRQSSQNALRIRNNADDTTTAAATIPTVVTLNPPTPTSYSPSSITAANHSSMRSPRSPRSPLPIVSSSLLTVSAAHQQSHNSDCDDQTTDAGILAVFVVSFDPRRGNVVEWQHPADADLSDVEFKAMPSGSHMVDEDFAHFSLGTNYGLSCYRQIKVDNTTERNARARSVGIISRDFVPLHQFRDFLRAQVRLELTNGNNRQDLIDFLQFQNVPSPRVLTISPRPSQDYGGIHQQNMHSNVDGSGSTSVSRSSTLNSTMINTNDEHLRNFVLQMGPMLFSLWKLVMLRKRILFVSTPPVGLSCQQVYLTWLLGLHSLELDKKTEVPFRPLFYVSVSDIPSLQLEPSFVACATERILEDRSPPLYDACLKQSSLKFNSKALCASIKISSGDRKRFSELKRRLNQCRKDHAFEDESSCDEQGASEQAVLMQMFVQLNNDIYSLLKRAAARRDCCVHRRELKALDLHSATDRRFVRQLAAATFPTIKVK